jgi:hypothetical protein
MGKVGEAPNNTADQSFFAKPTCGPYAHKLTDCLQKKNKFFKNANLTYHAPRIAFQK